MKSPGARVARLRSKRRTIHGLSMTAGLLPLPACGERAGVRGLSAWPTVAGFASPLTLALSPQELWRTFAR